MKKDFETFYKELDKKELENVWEGAVQEKNKKNKIALRTIGISNGVVLFFIAVAILLFGKFKLYSLFVLFQVFIFVLVIDIFIYVILSIALSKKTIEYNSIFKEKVIDKLLNNFFENVDYVPKKEMPESVYQEGNYPGYYNKYYSDDFVDAKMIDGKYPVKMAEVTTQDVETETDSDGNSHTTTTTIFSGVFAKINIDKSINSELRITRNKDSKRKDRLEMDSQEFESYFDVTSTNQIIGMQLLTHDIMDLLVNFRKIFKKAFDILIKDNVMYIRLHVGRMFEGKVNKEEIIDRELVKEYSDILDFINTLAKEIVKVVEETEL